MQWVTFETGKVFINCQIVSFATVPLNQLVIRETHALTTQTHHRDFVTTYQTMSCIMLPLTNWK